MSTEQLISFARGAPSLDIIDIDGLKAAAEKALTEDPAGATAYGNSYGYPPLRKWIAAKRGVSVDQVLVTNGSMQADAFLFEHFVGQGTEVVVEKPTYDRTLLNLRGLGASVRQVTLEPDGLDVAELRKLLESGLEPRLAHIIPNYQNPAGVTLALPKRQALVELAIEYGFTVFEDDPYAEIRFRGDPLPSMLSLDTTRPSGAGSVVHASSFTKTVCPGVRVGYLVGPAALIEAVARRATTVYISAGQLAQAIVYQFCISGGLARSIETVRTALAQRAKLLADGLRTHIPEARFTEPDGGYFLWVELPESVDADALLPAAQERGVAIVKGSDFLLEGGRHAVRLAYSAVPSDQVDEGVQRLAHAVRAARKTG